MLLTVDVGNTNAVMGVFDGDELVEHWRAASDPRRTADEWLLLVRQFLAGSGFPLDDVEGIAVASVVPKVTTNLRRMCERMGRSPLVVDWRTDTGMPVLLDDPSEAGADRLANAVAAYDVVRGPVVVVDLGTATTFDVVSGAGEYLGGVILPGIEISLDALFDRAAALRRIDLTPPDRVLGSSTATAVRSGATFGYAAQIDGLCARLQEEIGSARFIATGGLASVIAPLCQRVHAHDPWLTLQGLRLIYQRNYHD